MYPGRGRILMAEDGSVLEDTLSDDPQIREAFEELSLDFRPLVPDNAKEDLADNVCRHKFLAAVGVGMVSGLLNPGAGFTVGVVTYIGLVITCE